MLAILEIPVYRTINSAYNKIKKQRRKTLNLFKKKLFFELVLIKRKEHIKDNTGI
jgi:hypothetical protein